MKTRSRTLRLLLALALVIVSLSGLATTAKADTPTTEYSFSLCYDVQRLPPFPKTGQNCNLYSPDFPLTGYGIDQNNQPVGNRLDHNNGDWKLIFHSLYKDMSTTDINNELATTATNYMRQYGLLFVDNIPIFELKEGNTHIAYGLLWAKTEKNSDPLVFFVGDTWPGGGGYALSSSEVTHGAGVTVTNDLMQIKQEFAGIDVAVTGGNNATKSGGNTTQTGLTGAMTQIVYVANTGYHFEPFTDITTNGITVKWVSNTQVTVSGTPTADTSVKVPDAVEIVAQKKLTPSGVFTATDSDKGTLSNVKSDMQYRIGDGPWTDVDSEDGIDLTGLSPCTIQVIARGDGVTTIDSDIQEIIVTKAEVPTVPSASDCTTLDNNDGKLKGVTDDMQYKASNAREWSAGSGQDIGNLAPATYYVRVKPNGTVLASENQPLTVRKFISSTVRFKVVGGSWADGTTGDKTVTLSGHEGDTLKLAESQIPAVGSNPSAGNMEGSWDTTPSTEVQISGDTVYTYTYATQPAPKVTYSCTNGNGSSWTKGGNDGLPLTFKRSEEDQANTAFSHFRSASVDGKELKYEDDYAVSQSGGAVVTLKPAFLNTLGTGEHTLTATFDDGTAEGKFSVVEAAPKQATVTFNANGGAGTMGSMAVAAGETITLPANKFTRSGYTFAGWNTQADGKGTSYKDKESIKVTSDLALYAQWTKNTTASTATRTSSTSSSLAKTGDPASSVSVAMLAGAGAGLVCGGKKRRNV